MDMLPASKSSNPFAFYPTPHPPNTHTQPLSPSPLLSSALQLSVCPTELLSLLLLTSSSLLSMRRNPPSAPSSFLLTSDGPTAYSPPGGGALKSHAVFIDWPPCEVAINPNISGPELKSPRSICMQPREL